MVNTGSLIKYEPDKTRCLCACVRLCAYNRRMRSILLWGLRYVRDWNRSELGIIILQCATEGQSRFSAFQRDRTATENARVPA